MSDFYKTRKTLLLRIKDQYNDDAWAEFSEVYKRYIYAIIRRMNINAADACDLYGLDMIVKNVVCNAKDASKISLSVNNTIDLTAKGASKFSYRGNAVITDLDLKDASEIIKLN